MPTRVLLVATAPRRVQEVLDSLLECAVQCSPVGGTLAPALRPIAWGQAARASPLALPDKRGVAGGPASTAAGKQRSLLDMVERDRSLSLVSVHRGRIFDRVHTVDLRLTRDVDGLGLGLAICRRMVALHEGTLSIQSVSGTGSTHQLVLLLDMEDDTSNPWEER